MRKEVSGSIALLLLTVFFISCEQPTKIPDPIKQIDFSAGWWKFESNIADTTHSTFIEYDSDTSILRAGTEDAEYPPAYLSTVKGNLSFNFLRDNSGSNTLFTHISDPKLLPVWKNLDMDLIGSWSLSDGDYYSNYAEYAEKSRLVFYGNGDISIYLYDKNSHFAYPEWIGHYKWDIQEYDGSISISEENATQFTASMRYSFQYDGKLRIELSGFTNKANHYSAVRTNWTRTGSGEPPISDDDPTVPTDPGITDPSQPSYTGIWWVFENGWYVNGTPYDLYAYYENGIFIKGGIYSYQISNDQLLYASISFENATSSWIGVDYQLVDLSQLPSWAY